MKYTVSVKFNKDFISVEKDKITVGVRAKPIQGKANEELIRRIAEHFGIAQSMVNIVAGARSKRKVVDILI